MILSVLLLIVILTVAAAYITAKIKKNDEHNTMMSNVYTVHGHILKSTLDTKPSTGIGSVGSSVSTDGTYYTHYTYKTYNLKSGFSVHFLVDFVMDDMRKGRKHIDAQPVTLFRSLNKDQTDPFLQYYRKGDLHSLDGTLVYVIDKDGTKRFYSFTPDSIN